MTRRMVRAQVMVGQKSASGNLQVDADERLAADKSQAAFPHHRFVIAMHSSAGVVETGLRVCPPEKKAQKLA